VRLIERGAGEPIVVVPGLQGRWEYMEPAIEALSRSFRVITFSLCGEPDCGEPYDPALGLDNFVAQVGRACDQARIESAIVCGISFGGVVAVHFAAARPDRTRALVLASAPGPRWRLRARHRRYLGRPRLYGPLFFAEAPLRFNREVSIALPRISDRFRFAATQLRCLARAPLSVARMAERARLIDTLDLSEECRGIRCPTLVVSGEASLDHVVPSAGASEYTGLIANARRAILRETGHLGIVTRPREFAAEIASFAAGVRQHAA
jgi:pimeloyl-ACP methyl ester carboxylesterase